MLLLWRFMAIDMRNVSSELVQPNSPPDHPLYSKSRRSFSLKPEITQKVKSVHSPSAHRDVLTSKSSTTVPDQQTGLVKIASLVGNHRSRTSAVMLGLTVLTGVFSIPTSHSDTLAAPESATNPTAPLLRSIDLPQLSTNNGDVEQLQSDVSAMQPQYAQSSVLIAQTIAPHPSPSSIANRIDINKSQFSGQVSVPIEVAAPKTKTFKPLATAPRYYNPGNTGFEGDLEHPSDRFPANKTGETSIGFAWPAAGKLSSRFGRRWGRMHKGIDIAGPIGTPINAAADGTVIAAGWSSGGYGNLVEVRHTDGTTTRYGHNSRLSVSVGQVVRQGQQIAAMGSTGHSTGSHLHFEIRPSGGNAVNPIAHLPANS
jgi:murein DD-endopeptidase MepM/ murein hydrolase activator NlpD